MPQGIVQRTEGPLSTQIIGHVRDEGKLGGHDIADCWQTLQLNTGHKFYGDFVAASGGRFRSGKPPHFPNIERHWMLSRVPLIDSQSSIEGSCTILDISDTGKYQKGLSLQGSLGQDSATLILEALHAPPQDTHVRILLLDIIDKHPDDAWCVVGPILDAVGLSLKILPAVFEAYLERTDTGRENVPRGFLAASHCNIGRSVMTVARDYLAASSFRPPVVVILDAPILFEDFSQLWMSSLAFFDDKPASHDFSLWPEIYKNLLERQIKSSNILPLEPETLFPMTVIPLIEVLLEQLRDHIRTDHAKLLNLCGAETTDNVSINREQVLEDMRFRLREQNSQFSRWIRNCKIYLKRSGSTPQDDPFSTIRDEIDSYFQDVEALEISVKEWLQLRYASLALEESKRAIELSDLQITESERGKARLSCPTTRLES